MEEAPPCDFGDGARVQDHNQQAIRKRYCHLTQHQIQEMESFFKDFPHPDEDQRRDLGNLLGLNSIQVMFWFQNQRNHMKKNENTLLIAENHKLQSEILKYKEALSNPKCPSCEGHNSIEELQLWLENAQLKEEIEKMIEKPIENPAKTSLSKLPPPPNTPMPLRTLDVLNCAPQPSMEMQVHGCSNVPQRAIINAPFTETEKLSIVELAIGAMEEFTKMARDGAPLWIPGMHTEILNQQEYVRVFPERLDPKPLGFKSEASRESITGIMNPSDLIEILMNMNQWSTMFSGIVSSAKTIEILSTGDLGSYDGALQAISAEFQVLSHLVPTRDSYFIRYCKLHPDGAWAVVDISLDYIRPGASTKCRRRPSGCMIQELSNGFSKVTWIEHVEVEDIVVHDLFKHLVNSNFAFGARRWIGTLVRKWERLAYTMASNIPPEDLSGITPKGRKSLIKFAEKIMQHYCNHVGASPSPAHVWTIHTTPDGADDVRVMTRKHIDASGTITGLVISGATSFSLPVPSRTLFDFLRNINSRNQWDVLTNNFLVHELAHIASGCDPGNFVSLLRADSENVHESSKIIIQETCTSSTGSFVVYTPIEFGAMNLVLSGSNPNYDTLLPSGFSIQPDGPGLSREPITNVGPRWCVGTFSYQVLVKETSTPLAPSIVSSLCKVMKGTIEKIQAAMMSVSA